MKAWFPKFHTHFLQAGKYGVASFSPNPVDIPRSTFKGALLTAPPTPDWWYRLVERTKSEIKLGLYPKKVLTHDISFVDDHPGEFIVENSYEGSFLLQLDDSRLMYGISPEKVIHKVGTEVTVEVLGGTAEKLLDENGEVKPKYRYEHQIIIDDLSARNPDFELVETLTQKDVEYTTHLKSIFKFQHYGNSILDIVDRVYPNYAIYSNKINDWWGTLVGYKNDEELELWLGIRCGLYFPRVGIHMIRSGVGITLDSNPDEEWQELYIKTGWLKKKN